MSDSFDPIKVLDYARSIKLDRQKYAHMIAQGQYGGLVELARNLYGAVSTYRYDYEPTNMDLSSQKLLLANLIAERFVLRKHYNLWKQLTIIIVGTGGGAGKTRYAVWSAYGALRLVGLSPQQAEEWTEKLTFFTSHDFVKFVNMLVKEKKWVPFIIFDDIGAQISKYWIFLGQHYWAYLFSVLDLLKDWTGVLILTARSLNSVPARLREIADIVVEVSEYDIQGVLLSVCIYRQLLGPSRVSHHPLFVDVMLPTIRIPDSVWRKMIESRHAVAKYRLEMLEQFLDVIVEIEKLRFAKMMRKLEKLKEMTEEETLAEKPSEGE